MTLLTPKTHPDHETVGQRFRFMGVVFVCDSYDPSCGFWMTPEDTSVEDPIYEGERVRRRNVSERAIGRTYHRIYSM